MLRAALRPAPLALLAVALLVATACALLGQWQVERSRASGVRPGLERAEPLTTVLEPATTFAGAADGQVVTARGEFAGGPQLLVDGRLQDGARGQWVVAPLRVADAAAAAGDEAAAVDGAAAGGSAALLPVVRGWVPEGTDAAALPGPPSGSVEVVGRLIAGEPPQGVGTGVGGAPVVTAVSPADLVNVWDGRLYTGFVIAAEPVPDAPLEVVPSRAPTVGTDWRNVSYALQWWLFAGFAVVVWWRVVRDRYLPLEGGTTTDEQPDDGPPGPSVGGWDDGAASSSRPEQHPQEVR